MVNFGFCLSGILSRKISTKSNNNLIINSNTKPSFITNINTFQPTSLGMLTYCTIDNIKLRFDILSFWFSIYFILSSKKNLDLLRYLVVYYLERCDKKKLQNVITVLLNSEFLKSNSVLRVYKMKLNYSHFWVNKINHLSSFLVYILVSKNRNINKFLHLISHTKYTDFINLCLLHLEELGLLYR